MQIIAAEEWARHPPTEPTFLIEPYLPRHGVVLLYGKKGRGKSPLGWSFIRAVAVPGESWLGHPVQRHGTVLYVEADTPPGLVHPRAHDIINVPGIVICFTRASDLCGLASPAHHAFRVATRDINPILVLVNSLRKVHPWDDKVSEAPQRVYGVFQEMFPDACIVFVHHEKKDPMDLKNKPADGEEFSGSLAWYNDCQVALRIGKAVGSPPKWGSKDDVVLTQTGSQIARAPAPLRLRLNDRANAFDIIRPPERVAP